MEAKLKSLKVVDLKQILTKGNVTLSGKANKADLIARIVASPVAIDAFNTLYPSEPALTAHDDLLAPPEDLDWTVDEVSLPKIDEPATEPITKASVPSPAEPTTTPASGLQLASTSNESSKTDFTPESVSNTADFELAKRKRRAARFGIPLVVHKAKTKSTTAKNADVPAHPIENVDKIKARAERFGLKTEANGKVSSVKDTQTSPGSKRKRDAAAPLAEVEVDPEELERRRKRAERFGKS
ncbi:hypothetical protein J3R30DRAFT_3715142 [Lentinula aciculospora]|uniref:THO1-MOS11 C-terminal domain-containing protein n=1 Tax=Lentinula aciculospora TaxID=153920 RepID=A0A9W9DGD7_9AGAR|nr:hypothetical protein J3R30DRAFT_3715142 [Lentinula aciculospora]